VISWNRNRSKINPICSMKTLVVWPDNPRARASQVKHKREKGCNWMFAEQQEIVRQSRCGKLIKRESVVEQLWFRFVEDGISLPK
jgi:hypothetical protein